MAYNSGGIASPGEDSRAKIAFRTYQSVCCFARISGDHGAHEALVVTSIDKEVEGFLRGHWRSRGRAAAAAAEPANIEGSAGGLRVAAGREGAEKECLREHCDWFVKMNVW